MLKVKRHILIAAALLAAFACDKTPEPETGGAGSPIVVNVSESRATKALLDNEAFRKDGNRIMVYDIYTSGNSAPQEYIKAMAGPDVPSNSPLHESGTTWPFADWRDGTTPVSYNWTADGVHKFFGWLAKDVNMTSYNTPDAFFGGTLTLNSNYRYMVPAKAMLYDSPQFDFLYSDIVVRDLDNNPDFSPVKLSFNHLFTAFSIGAVNNTDSDIIIHEFELVNLYNSSSANVDFSGETVAVNYSEYTKVYQTSDNVFNSMSEDYTLYGGQQARNEGTNATGNIFEGAQKDRKYVLMWPQTDLSKIHSTKEPQENEDGTIAYPDEWMMYIRYTADGHEVRKRLNFPALAWEAGRKYHFDVTFADKIVDLTVKVNPWIYEGQDIDYSNDGVAVTGNHVLTWDQETYHPSQDPTQRYLYVKNGMPVEGTFQLEAPMGGTWLATLTGDIDAFDVTPESGVIDGSVARIKVTPKPEALGLQREFKVKVKFAVRRPDGRTIAADSVLQPEGTEYTIILLAN